MVEGGTWLIFCNFFLIFFLNIWSGNVSVDFHENLFFVLDHVAHFYRGIDFTRALNILKCTVILYLSFAKALNILKCTVILNLSFAKALNILKCTVVLYLSSAKLSHGYCCQVFSPTDTFLSLSACSTHFAFLLFCSFVFKLF